MSQKHKHWLEIAKGLLNQPTAPLMEELPKAFIREFAAKRPALKFSEDPSGNLLVKYRGAGSTRAPLVLVAHLDHPGFWVEKVTGNTARLIFKGGVHVKHAQRGAPVRFFERGYARAIGAGTLTGAEGDNDRLVGASVQILEGRAAAGGFAMWDFPGFSVEKGLIVTRCCDDLLGAAAALCTLDEVARRKPRGVSLWGLFTRAEEVGFMGAFEAMRHKVIPRQSAVLSLECSKALANAPQGDGVIIRVGDRSSIFDPALTEALCRAAEKVKKKDARFKYQRKLMDGGTCEATVFCASGFRSSGVAVPLGNYHNQAVDAKGNPDIGAESVRVDDYNCEVDLLVRLALQPELLDTRADLPAWFKSRATDARTQLNREVVVSQKRRKSEM